MCKTEELLSLMDLDKALKKFEYDKLNLMNIDPLRIEVKRRINKIKL